MAYDKPLKMQWTEINGRPVPLVLPQFWDEDKQDWVVSSTANRLPVDAQLTGRNVLLQSATGVNVSAGSTLVAIGSTIAENISGLYVLARADASHKYRVRVDHHRETGSTFSKFSGDFDALPSAERLYGVSGIVKPVGYRFGILVYNESEEDHIYDVEVRSE